MIIPKEEFIERYLKVLNHKVEQELREKLPAQGFFLELVPQANEIVRGIVKEG